MPASPTTEPVMDDFAAHFSLGEIEQDWQQGLEPKNLLGLGVAGYLVIGGLAWLVASFVGKADLWFALACASFIVIPLVLANLAARARALERQLRCRIHEHGLVIRDRGVLYGGRWEQLGLPTKEVTRGNHRWWVQTPMGAFTVGDFAWHRIADIVARVKTEHRARGITTS